MKSRNFVALAVLFALLFSLHNCDSSGKKQDAPLPSEELTTNRTVSLLDSMIQLDPRNADLYYDRALYYHQEGVYPKAMSDIYSALHIDSANVSYYMLAGEIFLGTGEGDKAVALMSKGINMNPGNEDLYIKAIEYNFYMRYYEAALNFANDLIKLNKYNPDAYFFKGLIFKEVQKEAQSISAFQTCIEVDPSYYNAHIQLGLIYSNKKEDVAIQYFENALALDEGSREAYYAIAYHYQNKEDYKKAIAKYREMIALNPKDHEVFFNVGHCYIALDSLDKAYKNFDIATQIRPQYAGAYYMKGNVSESIGNKEDALKNYQQALKMLPDDTRIIEAIERLK